MKHYMPAIIFLLSLLPLGYGHTLYGTHAVLLLMMMVGLTLCIFTMMIVLSDLAEKNRFQNYIIRPCTRAIFRSAERKFLIGIFCSFLAISLAISYFINGFTPAVQDSVAQLIHAKMLASGSVSLPAYPFGGFFTFGGMINDGGHYSQYPPGHILLLAIGLLLGAPFLVNPLLGAVTCVAVYALAKTVYNKKTARFAALLCLGSPFLILMSSEFMNHGSALFFATLFLLAFIKTQKTPTFFWACIAGFAIGYVVITRPLTGVAIALPAAIYSLYLLWNSPRRYIRYFCAMTLIAAIPIAFLLWFNLNTTGDALTLAYDKASGAKYGFGAVPQNMEQWALLPDHTLWRGIGMVFNSTIAMHWFLFNWPTTSLLFVLIAFTLRKLKNTEKLLWATILSLIVFYIPYYFQNWLEGPRFAYEIIGILFIFTAFGIARTPALILHLRLTKLTRNQLNDRLCFVLLALASFTWAYMLIGMSNQPNRTDKLLAMQTLEQRIQKPTIIFMPYEDEYFRLAGIYYPITSESNIIPARDLDKKNASLMQLYPNHDAFRASHIGTYKEIWQRLK